MAADNPKSSYQYDFLPFDKQKYDNGTKFELFFNVVLFHSQTSEMKINFQHQQSAETNMIHDREN